MRGTPLHIVRFFVFVLLQGLVFGQLELGMGIHIMIYPLFILLLPFETSGIALMFIGFITGLSIDFFMNTFGLHASAGLLVAYIRPQLYLLFSPRDGYDILQQPTASSLGFKWFLSVSGIAVLIHHLWFFILELFRLSDFFYLLQQTLLSAVFTLLVFILIQLLFFKKEKS
jgi:hypothetical protein